LQQFALNNTNSDRQKNEPLRETASSTAPLLLDDKMAAPLRRNRLRMNPHFSDSTSVVLPTPLLPTMMTRIRLIGFDTGNSWRATVSRLSRTIDYKIINFSFSQQAFQCQG
jgi:hypothetical protein